MASAFDRLHSRGLLSDAPHFLKNAVQYEVIMGSVAYGVSDDFSDADVYAFAIPPKQVLNPYSHGFVYGFDAKVNPFEQYQKHHIQDTHRLYDLSVYNICKYFRLVAENNPNMVDSLFVPQNCVLYSSNIGNMVREQRHIFLHKGCWHKFKGYAYAQLHKLKSKSPEGKRQAIVEKYGFDVKFAYHVVRLMLEIEQLLAEQDLDLQRHKEQLKAIRQGAWSLQQIDYFFTSKEKQLESLYASSKLPYKPDLTEIRSLLEKCIAIYFSEQPTAKESDYEKACRDIKVILDNLKS